MAGCPNSATDNTFGDITQSASEYISTPRRIEAIYKEKMRNPNCLTCDVNYICNGDCYKLKWDGHICATPKSLMRLLAGNHQPNFQQMQEFIR